jgi:lysophospholipase L1-like esterase
MSKTWRNIGLVIGASVVLIALTSFTISRRKKRIDCDSSFLFIGDSTTAKRYGYVEMLKERCPNAVIKKIAEGSKKSDWMLDKLKEELKRYRYDVIVVLGGSNDIFARKENDKLRRNMNEFYTLAKMSGAKMVAISPPNKKFFPKTEDIHRKLIAEFEHFIKFHPNVDYYVDLAGVVDEQSLFASDNQHINTDGHRVLLNEFINETKLKS